MCSSGKPLHHDHPRYSWRICKTYWHEVNPFFSPFTPRPSHSFKPRKTRRSELGKWDRNRKKRRPPATIAYETSSVTDCFVRRRGIPFTITSGRRNDNFINPDHEIRQVCVEQRRVPTLSYRIDSILVILLGA